MGQLLFSIDKHDPCPALKFQGDLAICQIAVTDPEMVGVGAGCCIKARARGRDGQWYDFATLPPAIKIELSKKAEKISVDNQQDRY